MSTKTIIPAIIAKGTRHLALSPAWWNYLVLTALAVFALAFIHDISLEIPVFVLGSFMLSNDIGRARP